MKVRVVKPSAVTRNCTDIKVGDVAKVIYKDGQVYTCEFNRPIRQTHDRGGKTIKSNISWLAEWEVEEVKNESKSS